MLDQRLIIQASQPHGRAALLKLMADVTAVHESSGGLVEAAVEDQLHVLADTKPDPPVLQPPVSGAQASEEVLAVGDDAFLLQKREQPKTQIRESPHSTPKGVVGRMITMSLLASVVVLLSLVFWEVINFVDNVPDPFKDVTDPKLIPVVIDDMIASGKSAAFVVRRCKFCGIGIRALRKAGKDTVVVMVEGHPYQGVISRHLRTRYGARGFPFFIIDSDRYGYLTKVKQYLQDELAQ
ncbi:hypothetical protein, conserved [Eimeria maxima]|uniref:Uncharacterized protein n=1 Tax=Eimeria maxima TaxID=5804 RepID=U6M827_EIMMA|nr:hypothetical protein, conserved [Eimeria maxima]CDJ59218.1 hypothetical protein, conserved [Eimeria maxima]